jgi:hypothetical protein
MFKELHLLVKIQWSFFVKFFTPLVARNNHYTNDGTKIRKIFKMQAILKQGQRIKTSRF